VKATNQAIKSRCLIIPVSSLSGNGTLNKKAGIDFKQLSLLAKINENQSGEVGCTPMFAAASVFF